MGINSIGNLVGELALQKVGNAADELHHFQAAGDFALGIRNGLSVLRRQELGKLIDVFHDEFAKLEHDGGALCRRRIGPGWKGMGCPLDGMVNVRGRGQGKAGCFGAERRVVDVGAAA